MAAPYFGAPTRIGRIMMAAFGAPFILSAVLLIGSAILGDDAAGEKLVMVLGALVFSIAGLFLWAPAIPGVVNRILESDNRFFRAVRPHAGTWSTGALVTGLGLVPLLAAVGVLPTDDSSWNAPRWVGGVAGGLFVVAGLYLVTKPWVDRLDPWLKKQITGLFPLLIVSGMASISSWIAFGPGEREFEGGVSNSFLNYSWGNAYELTGRIAFGVGAIFLIVTTVIGWWKYLRGRW